jgi:hypothetical protein
MNCVLSTKRIYGFRLILRITIISLNIVDQFLCILEVQCVFCEEELHL